MEIYITFILFIPKSFEASKSHVFLVVDRGSRAFFNFSNKTLKLAQIDLYDVLHDHIKGYMQHLGMFLLSPKKFDIVDNTGIQRFSMHSNYLKSYEQH